MVSEPMAFEWPLKIISATENLYRTINSQGAMKGGEEKGEGGEGDVPKVQFTSEANYND